MPQRTRFKPPLPKQIKDWVNSKRRQYPFTLELPWGQLVRPEHIKRDIGVESCYAPYHKYKRLYMFETEADLQKFKDYYLEG